MAAVKFTKKEIMEHAIGNAGGLWYATLEYFKSKGENAEDWIEGIGKLYGPGWEELKGKGALATLRMAVVDWVSCGATCISLQGNADRAEAILEWPLDNWGSLSYEEAHKVNNVFHPITHAVDLKCTWKSEGKTFRLVFSKD